VHPIAAARPAGLEPFGGLEEPLNRCVRTVCSSSDEPIAPEIARLNIDIHALVAYPLRESRSTLNEPGIRSQGPVLTGRSPSVAAVLRSAVLTAAPGGRPWESLRHNGIRARIRIVRCLRSYDA
jgi:hypothetical protein